MSIEKGSLSINSENIFPIIKKWLYSDHDIFVREMISNGCDAITKLKKLEIMGEYQFPEDQEFSIQVIVNPTKKTLKFIDNGIGMTAEEVKEYINQIAFSGASAFMEQYKDKATEDQIIGHFGLGFYSAFMVADKVTIETLSYREGAKAVYWECDGGTEFEMKDSDKETVGTEITLYLNEDSYEFSNEYRVKEVIGKYCSFMPEEIYLVNTDTVGKEQKPDSSDGETKEPEEPKPLNDTHPLWTKHPNECTEEEYKEFYRRVFNDYKEPLFWIHLNMDYPFNLKGILYFPKLNTQYDTLEGVIKLYNNQVFIADNIKEVIPEFLMLLKGVIDCPDLPLNVSRSALQNDGFVTKISDYISKKVADKLSGMCKTDRENYEKYWDDINPFIKYGCLKDAKFCEKMSDYILFKDLNDKYLTYKEYVGEPEEEEEEKTESAEGAEEKPEEKEETKEPKTIFYVSDRNLQGQYINMFREAKMDAVYLEHVIDSSFISQLEARNEGLKFMRIDTDLSKAFRKRTSKKDQKELDEKAEKLRDRLRTLTGNDKIEVKIQNLKNKSTASMLTVSEESKRMEEMMLQMGMGRDMGQFKQPGTLVLNAQNELVRFVMDHEGDEQETDLFLEQLYDLAKLGNEPLTPEEMGKFIARSNEIMLKLAK
ncbi:MAG: molecular chaperone HtpG [Parasporobacterium sp.]|nr:molecular chaperone HtpG [Parasporobacterium sp.]